MFNYILFYLRNGVLEMTMDGQLVHYTYVPSIKSDYDFCMRHHGQGTVKVCFKLPVWYSYVYTNI